jgi:hypothetical protein
MLFALLGAGQLLPALHFAFVAHRVCAEHGASFHSELHAEPEAGERSATAVDAAEIQVEPAPGLPEHEHEHCSVLAAPGTAGVAFVPAACSANLPPAWEQLATLAERTAHVDIALLRYAPKLAPPA